MSRRSERIGSLIRDILADAIQTRLSDPRIPTITSITRVSVSEDLSVARVFVSVMASEPKRRLCVEALQSAAGRMRRLLRGELTVRKVPELVFKEDASVRTGIQTVNAIDQAMRELGVRPAWEDAGGDDHAGADAAQAEPRADDAAPRAAATDITDPRERTAKR